jgi:hypothetical protein
LVPVSKPTTSAPADGVQWCMLAYVKDRTTGRFYLDGTRSSSDYSAAITASFNSTDLCVGKDYRDGNSIAGSIGLLAAFNRALSDVELSALHDSYRGRFSPAYKIAAPSLTYTPITAVGGRAALGSLLLANAPVAGPTTWALRGAPSNFVIDPATGEVSAAAGTLLSPSDVTVVATNSAGTSTSTVTIGGTPTFPAAPMGADYTPVAASAVSAAAYGAGCGHGDHVCQASSGTAWKAFTCATGADAGWAPTGAYTITTGAYPGTLSTTSSSGTHAGEWVQLRLPHPVLVSGYAITVRDVGTSPQDWVLLGSNDGGATWSLLDTVTGNKKFAGMTAQSFWVTGNYGAHSTFRLAVSKANGGGTTVGVYDLRLLGRPIATPMLAQPAYELGVVGMSPWTWSSSFSDASAKWIWNTSTAATSADNMPITVYGYYYNATGASIVATLKGNCDDTVVGGVNGSQTLTNTNTTITATLVPGMNTLSFLVTNGGGAAGFLASMADASGNVLWRSNKTLACTFLPSTANIVGFYTSDSLAGGVALHDLSGSGNHAVVSGSGVAKAAMATGTRNYMYGGTGAMVQFPYNVLPPNYTLFHVSKYNGTNKGRILASANNKLDATNWLSGFWARCNGVAYHNAWLTANPPVSMNHNGFILSTDQKGQYRSNKVLRGTLVTGVSTPYMSINDGQEFSDWAVAMILVFNTELSATDIAFVEAWIDTMYPSG